MDVGSEGESNRVMGCWGAAQRSATSLRGAQIEPRLIDPTTVVGHLYAIATANHQAAIPHHLHHQPPLTMATSANERFAALSPTNQVCAHAALKVAQAASMIFPPAYVGLSLIRKRPMSVSRAMRGAELSVWGGAALGWGAGYARLQNQSPEQIEDRVYRLVSGRGIEWEWREECGRPSLRA